MIPQPPMQPQPAGPPQQPPVTIDACMELLRDGMTRRFRIDIEVDSTITGDESQERQDRTQFIEATTKFIQAWGPIVQAQPALTQLAGELLLFGTRAFRVGRALEEVIEETVDKLEFEAAQPKPPPPIPPEEQAKIQQAQIKAQAEGQKAQADIQGTMVKSQAEQQKAKIDIAGKMLDHQHKMAEHQMKKEQMQMDHAIAGQQAARDMHQAQVEAAINAQGLRNQAAAQQHKHELTITEMDRRAKEAKAKPKDK